MPLKKSKSRAAFVSNFKAELDAGKPRQQALAIAYAVKRRAKRASGGAASNPALWDLPEEEIPHQDISARRGVENVASGLGHIAKSILWDVPHRAIESAKGTTYGLRREDFTDVPPDYSPDPSKAIAPLGLPKGGWQPTDEMIGASLESGMNVMGGTALSSSGKAAGEFVAGAGPRDPALWHGISKVKLPKPISEMSAVHAPTSTFAERFVDPASLQGGRLLPLIGDRTRAGTSLQQVNGYRFDQPVSMQGGHGFMAENADKGAAWASGQSVTKRLANTVRREAGDAPVYGVYTAMGERSGDFSHHVSDTLAEMLKHSKVTKAGRREFDETMRLIAPDWPGVKSEKLRPYLIKAPGDVRANFAKLMDTAKYQNQGFPSVAEARFATTDPRLLNEPTGASGLSMAKLDPEGRTFQSADQHLSYDTNLGGQYVGGLPTSIPKEVMYPDIVRSIEGYRDALPGYKPTVDYLMTRTPKGLPVTQEANQQWVDTVSKHLEDRGFKLGAGANDRRAAGLAAADDILARERALAPAFYSHIDQTMEGITQPMMTAEQWAGTLANRGVKADEMAARGLDQFLAARAGQPVSRQEVLAHLDQNKLELGQVNKADKRTAATGETIFEARDRVANERYGMNYYDLHGDQQADILRDMHAQSPTKYHSYQLPGGENYREKLLTLPTDPRVERLRELNLKRAGGEPQTLAEREEYRDLLASGVTDAKTYRSSHWDEGNVLAHRRSNERDVDGQRSLHIEEIQSDWHQAGRKQGYKKEQPQFWVRNTRSGNNSPFFDTKAEAEAYRNSLPESIRTSTVISQRPRTTGEIPNAPFKKNWHEIVAKDAIREAAEKGLTRISWTPGKAQNERYSLAKTFSEISVVPTGDGGKVLWPKTTTGQSAGSITVDASGKVTKANRDWGAVVGKNLDDVIGKDVADRAMKAEKETKLSGVDLEVGGEGMKGFYDKMLVDYFNKLGKPHGVRVQKGATGTDRPGYDVIDNAGANYATFKGPPTQEQLRRIAIQERIPFENLTVRKNKGSEAEVHYMDIPQSMKDEALYKGFRLGAGATDKRAASLAAVDDILDAERRLAGTANEPRALSAEPAAAAGPEAVGPGGGGAFGAGSLPEAQATAARWAGDRQPLPGTPGPLKINGQHFVPGPIGKIHDVAEAYMRARHPDRPYTPPTQYHPLDPEHSKAIAQAYEEMKHTPNDPATKASYDALIQETADQYQAIKATGLKIEPIPADMPDPYAANPRMAAIDVAENNHLWFYPTEQGFGTVNKISDNPMLRPTGEKIGDHELLANDMFRIVHDYFGHLKEGHGFRAAGEDNAWRTHSAMYSDLARPAMTTETRGQNSWVNYGPHGEKNRTATAADTVYADQKVGLLPEWVMRDRGSPEPIIFYHGTPHSFNRFDISKIGAGEGNQAYGHGLYFAGHEPVSEWYRHQLATRQDPLLKKYKIEDVGHVIGSHLSDAGGDAAMLAQEYAALRQRLIDHGPDDKATANMIKDYDRRIAYLNDPQRATGHMYQVTADVDPQRLLDYDVPFVDQTQFVQGRTGPVMEQSVKNQVDAIKQALAKGTSGTGRWERPLLPGARAGLEGRLLSLEQAGHTSLPGKEIYKRMGLPAKTEPEGAVKSAKRLLGMDIPGLRYRDAGSRAPGQKGSYNYVMFSDDMLKILRKYGVVGIPAAGVLSADGEEQRATGGKVNAALEVARRIKRKKGGAVHVGPIVGDTGGRADKVPMEVPDGAYVIPADIVSGLGEGNTAAGMLVLGDMFPESKPSLMRGMPHKGVPILAADGEFVISPTSIEERWGDLESGHKSLDAWVLQERQSLIDTLSNLDPPAQD